MSAGHLKLIPRWVGNWLGSGGRTGNRKILKELFRTFIATMGTESLPTFQKVPGYKSRIRAQAFQLPRRLGVASVDVDNDGWVDLIVANDTVQNFLFHNEKNGTFKEIGGRSGIAFDSFGATRGAMGIDVGRYRENEEALGVVIGNFANEMTALYVSRAGQGIQFNDEALTEGLVRRAGCH